MNDLENRFEYPKHNDFFVVEQKEVTLKPEYADYITAHPGARECWNVNAPLHRRGESCYTESGVLLFLPEGPEYLYERDEIGENSIAHVIEGMVVSAACCKQDKSAANVWPIFNETFFKDIPEIDNLLSRLEKAVELGTVRKPELERIMPIIKNQRIAHEILNELCERYGIKRDDKIKVHSRKCPYGGPVPSMEQFDYTIFCYVGQNIYRSGEPGPYHGWRIFCIDFPGWDLIHELVKEKCFKKS